MLASYLHMRSHDNTFYTFLHNSSWTFWEHFNVLLIDDYFFCLCTFKFPFFFSFCKINYKSNICIKTIIYSGWKSLMLVSSSPSYFRVNVLSSHQSGWRRSTLVQPRPPLPTHAKSQADRCHCNAMPNERHWHRSTKEHTCQKMDRKIGKQIEGHT